MNRILKSPLAFRTGPLAETSLFILGDVWAALHGGVAGQSRRNRAQARSVPGRAAAWSDNGEWLYYLDGPPNDPKEPTLHL